jgi:HEAT repeat protein
MPLIRKPANKSTDGSVEPVAIDATDSFDARSAAIHNLASQADVPGLMTAFLGETNPRIQGAVFAGLARVGSKESVAALLPYLRGDDATLRTSALDALRAMPNAVRPELKNLLNDPDSDVRLLACEIVRSLDSQEASHLLCALIQNEPDANVCGAAVEVLIEVGGAEALPHLAACAERFRGDSFLTFAIEVAVDRLRSRLAP